MITINTLDVQLSSIVAITFLLFVNIFYNRKNGCAMNAEIIIEF